MMILQSLHQPRLQRKKTKAHDNSFSLLSVSLDQGPGRLPLAPTPSILLAVRVLFRGQFLFSVLRKKLGEIRSVFYPLLDQERHHRVWTDFL